jgi:hypothetical protein
MGSQWLAAAYLIVSAARMLAMVARDSCRRKGCQNIDDAGGPRSCGFEAINDGGSGDHRRCAIADEQLLMLLLLLFVFCCARWGSQTTCFLKDFATRR